MSDLKVGRIEQLTHTPGPWKAQERVNGRWVVGAPSPLGGRGPTQGLTILWDVAAGKPAHDNTAEGNARLIAAAPELLDLLQRIHERLTDGRDVPEWAEAWTEEIAAAIAKAEGQP